MELDPRICYRALRTRDPRFDGRFFTGVVTTGIFCRPVCPARTPKLENCRFFRCAAAAQEAGFRPCLRCRPEASPGTPAWLGTSGTVSRALRLIHEGALDEAGVDELAARLGLGGRHLRRLFDVHLGTSPLAVALTQRVLFAKKLIDETDLPFVQVALSSGFSSVRRFNDAMLATYGRSPSELRGATAKFRAPVQRLEREPARNGRDLVLRLPYRRPFQWQALIGFLGARAIPGVESVSAGAYRRTLRVDGGHGIVEVQPVLGRDWLLARLQLPETRGLIQVVERLRRIFDLGADPEEIASHLGADARLAAAVSRLPGLRVPGAWDAFELAVRAVLGQQVSVRAATTLAGRIAARWGEPLSIAGAAGELQFVFPGPEALADADLTAIGLTRARARTIQALAAAVARGDLSLDAPDDLETSIERLMAVPGIGSWTAHYIAMRALREPDAFPAGDLGLRYALAPDGNVVSAAAVERAAETWRPWRAYAAMYLWAQLSEREKKSVAHAPKQRPRSRARTASRRAPVRAAG